MTGVRSPTLNLRPEARLQRPRILNHLPEATIYPFADPSADPMASPDPYSPAALRSIARRLFTRGPGMLRRLQHHRPSICPFGAILEYVPEHAAVLDIGCGGGLLLGLIGFTRSPASLTGFDSSAKAIELAQANLPNFLGAKPQFLRLGVEDPWPQGPFTCVTLCDVLHHVGRKHHRALLEQAALAVPPGGRFIYKDVYPEGLIRPNASRLHDLVLAGEHIDIPHIADVTTMLGAVGLKRVVHKRINMLWYGHELAVFERV